MPGRPYIQAPFPVPQRLEALVMDGFILSSSNQCSNPAGLERKQWDRSVHESIKETRVPDRSQPNTFYFFTLPFLLLAFPSSLGSTDPLSFSFSIAAESEEEGQEKEGRMVCPG